MAPKRIRSDRRVRSRGRVGLLLLSGRVCGRHEAGETSSGRGPFGWSGQSRRAVQLLQTPTNLHTRTHNIPRAAQRRMRNETAEAETKRLSAPRGVRCSAALLLTSAMASCDCLSLIAAGDGDGMTARLDASSAALARLGSVPLIVRREAGVRSADCWPGARTRLCSQK